MPETNFRLPRGKYSNGRGEVAELPDSSAACSHALTIGNDLARGMATELKSQPSGKWRSRTDRAKS
jgi:hypothetical protein